MILLLNFSYFTTFSFICIVEFEQVNVSSDDHVLGSNTYYFIIKKITNLLL